MKFTTPDRIILFGSGVFVGLAVGMPLGLAIATPKDSSDSLQLPATGTSVTYAEYVYAVTGVQPAEDDPTFDCRLHGNRICGPGNAQGVAPGLYRDVAPGTTLVDLMLGDDQ